MGKRKKTHEEFIKEMENINPNIEVLGKYVDAKTKVLCKCKVDGYEWMVRPYGLLNGYGCPKCAGNIKKTHEEFISEMEALNPDIKILGTYTGAHKKIECECRICGKVWEIKPNNLLNGQSCPTCWEIQRGVKRRKTHEEFVEELSEINPDIEILSEFKNLTALINCKCKIDGYEWEARAQTLLRGHKCPQCSNKIKITHEEFINKLEQINPNIEVLGEYINKRTKILCRCKLDEHEWLITPCDLLKGHGCPMCKTSHGERDIKRFLSNNGITYKCQKKYKDLIGTGGGQLSYDFYLPDYNLLIEYQGEQHDRPVDVFGGRDQFEIQQEHDKRKREYAQKNGIELLEIWYWDYNNIEDILTSRLLLERSA